MAQKNTKVLFVKYHEAADQQPLSKKAAEKLGIFPSLALAGLAAWVRQHEYPVEFIDLHVENLYPNDITGRVKDYDPQVVALTSKTLGWPAVIEIAQMVRETCPNALIVVGGPHMTIYAEESLTWECFDIAVVGDGEDTFLEICDHVEQGGGGWDEVAGIVYRTDTGELKRTESRPLSKDIDKYPMTAWDLMPVSDYHLSLIHI